MVSLSAIGSWISAYGGYVAAAASVASAAVQAGAAASQASAQSRAQRDLAKAQLQEARQAEAADRDRSRRIIAQQRAEFAAAGWDVDTGTPLEAALNSAYDAEYNALQIRKQGLLDRNYSLNAARQARGQIPGIIFSGVTKAVGSGLTSYKAFT